MEPYLPGILLAYGVFMVGIFSPGPNIMAVIGTSMAIGRGPGRALAAGVATGSLIWGLLTLAGVSALLSAYASVLTVLKIGGALYLLWLAFKALRSAATPGDPATTAVRIDGPLRSYYWRGLAVQMSNPKAALTWIAIMSLALDGAAPLWAGAVVVAGTGVISLLGHLAYAQLFSTAPMIAAYRRARRWVEGALGVFFCYASYRLLSDRT